MREGEQSKQLPNGHDPELVVVDSSPGSPGKGADTITSIEALSPLVNVIWKFREWDVCSGVDFFAPCFKMRRSLYRRVTSKSMSK
ncbi:hypothetical protein TNCV_2559181 [Trichonephila clavipes]|nr:hypothetical protein TNCV_2559181 [Trichonephila clavipes]